MKISVITPSFNQGRFIEEAIQSVIDQNYADFEHIIIDACSTDETIKVLKRFPHLIWISEPDEGQSDALNKGFKLAAGDALCWLNADDFYLPETFKKVANTLSNPGIDLVYANNLFCNAIGKITGRCKSHIPVRWLSVFHIFISSETIFFRKKIIDNNILIDKKFEIAMDKEFMANLLFKGYKAKYINDEFAVFRNHDSNKSLDNEKTRKIRSSEGIEIFNRYNRLFKFKLNRENKIHQQIYIGVRQSLLFYRAFLRIISI